MRLSRRPYHALAPSLILALALASPARAQEGDGGQASLAAKTQDPVADLISVPLQLTATSDQGADGGTGWVLNIQPVVPTRVSEKLNLILRPIVPVLSQPSPLPGGDRDRSART